MFDSRTGTEHSSAHEHMEDVVTVVNVSMRIPEQSGHPFRLNPATCSGRIRPPSLDQSGHRVRRRAATAKVRQ